MFGIDDAVGAALNIGGKLIDRLIPDPAAAAQAKLELVKMQQTGELAQLASDTEIIKAGASIVQAEAQSQSWLTCNWRPITMLSFLGFIGAYWFGYTVPNLPLSSVNELFGLMKLGLGGYVIGRSAEQTAKAIAPAIAGALSK